MHGTRYTVLKIFQRCTLRGNYVRNDYEAKLVKKYIYIFFFVKYDFYDIYLKYELI